MRLWISAWLHALPHYATANTIKTRPRCRQVRSLGEGWEFAYAHNRDKAEPLVKGSPISTKDGALDAMLKFSFSPRTLAEGWGTMDPAGWQDQISLYAELGQFSKRVPKLEEVMTLDILKATAAGRPKIG